MTVIVESKRMKVTKALRSFIEKQTRKIVKLNKNAKNVRVHLETIEKKSNDPLSNVVTFLVEIPGRNIVIKKHAVNMYDAIVAATESAARQLRKRYEKRKTVQRHRRNEVLDVLEVEAVEPIM
ncbi:MAG: ribosome-associated translation inhibitor RaiA [Candidatus Pacebacteria bacterium]|nr:ribosome-associated translation inhibitor RaiA [Candidatus Paceibacterota bacterium]PIR63272.1 MAG: ribosomal subunit interface protein [Candidatus Pacebacteria bacterium CG10_big_fil_rev_8_21_14_0_10_40_26]PIZ79153.1 MAG: ribosomal subunit interface protein [Candidatus Pacebacteria bacterium CG_4_10_14_0_2_um_filter_40_20]PJA68808.1 MAG: ribosomal subunit interface protein [Candidatus Pacebacteria bacterium CG_4_9_14_3_um_filter_40_12]PJC42119.1 MAG: ribosomal subunit interface protein [Can